MHIAMIGAGYVGLVSGACFSDFGHQVVCIDSNAEKVESLNNGEMPIYEPGLGRTGGAKCWPGPPVIRERSEIGGQRGGGGVHCGRHAVAPRRRPRRSVLCLCGGARDRGACFRSARWWSPSRPFRSAPATRSSASSAKRTRTPTVAVVSNPEFLREGAAIRDFKHPDRIVIGTDDARARGVMAEVYRPLHLNASPILYTDRRTAELTKYAANSFLATKIAFINEIADLAEKVGANVQEVARGIGLDNRIGRKFLHAGPGFGGSCFPKDAMALIKTGQDNESPVRIVETVVAVNDQRKRAMARKVANAFGGNIRGKSIAVLGVTFKPDTDDMRDAPSIPLITALQDMGAEVRIFDPVGMQQAKKVFENVTFSENAYRCAKGCHALVIVTEWEQFRALDLKELSAIMACPVIVDLRNIYSQEEVERNGFLYCGVGRPKSVAY